MKRQLICAAKQMGLAGLCVFGYLFLNDVPFLRSLFSGLVCFTFGFTLMFFVALIFFQEEE